MPRNDKGTRIRGWILKNTRISPVLKIKVCYRDDRYKIKVQIPSLFQDHTVSLVRIVNGVDIYVTESMLTAKEEDTASGKHIAKARPRQKPTVTLTSISIPVHEKQWIDIETQRSHDYKCYEVSKAIIGLLRHDQSLPRGSDGAIHYSDIIEECRMKKFDGASQWLARGGEGAKKEFQCCANPNSPNQLLYLREIQGHPGDNAVDRKTMYCYRKDLPSTSITSGNANELISLMRHGLIPGGTSLKKGRQAVFFTTVNQMEDVLGMVETPCDLRKPRIAPYKNTWKRL